MGFEFVPSLSSTSSPAFPKRKKYISAAFQDTLFHSLIFVLDRSILHPIDPFFDMAAEVATRKCVGVDCQNDAGSLQCPTCLKSGIDSFFCSQDCFKRSWVGFLVLPEGAPAAH
jgi:hypothetical protein